MAEFYVARIRSSFAAWLVLGSLSAACTTSGAKVCQQGDPNCSCAPGILGTTCTSSPTQHADAGGDAGSTNPVSNPQTSDDAGGSTTMTQTASDIPCDVFKVLQDHCYQCHGAQTSFGAPMSLYTAEDFQGQAPSDSSTSLIDMALMRLGSASRPMPPPTEPRLSDAEMKTLTDWLNSGAPQGSGCQVEVAPGDGGTDGAVDGGGGDGYAIPADAPSDCKNFYEFRAHGVEQVGDTTPYQVPVHPDDTGNQYMCFYFKPPYEGKAQALWFDGVIDEKRVLHHWLLYGTDAAQHPAGTRGPCSAAEPGAYMLAGWAPGATNLVLPDDVGLQMPNGPDSGLILEVHYYNPNGLDVTDRSGVRLCTAPENTRTHTAGVHFLGSEGICIPPEAQKDVVGQCDPPDDRKIHILNVWPHMHYMGRHMKAVINRKGGTTEVLHDAAFDFNYQVNYPKNDIIINAGDTITTTCSYQNTTNHQIHFGDRTQDEMCYLFVTAWPVGSLEVDPVSYINPITAIASTLQPARRCMDLTSIFQSCDGLADYPSPYW